MKLKIGDKVEILDGRESRSSYVSWCSSWNHLIGTTSYVTRVVNCTNGEKYYFLNNNTRDTAALYSKWIKKVR